MVWAVLFKVFNPSDSTDLTDLVSNGLIYIGGTILAVLSWGQRVARGIETIGEVAKEIGDELNRDGRRRR